MTAIQRTAQHVSPFFHKALFFSVIFEASLSCRLEGTCVVPVAVAYAKSANKISDYLFRALPQDHCAQHHFEVKQIP